MFKSTMSGALILAAAAESRLGDDMPNSNWTLQVLDDMEVYFHGAGNQYDRDYFTKLQKCFNAFGDDLMEKSQNGFWKGFVQYYQNNGTDKDYQGYSDHWGRCYHGLEDPRDACQGHVERNQVKGMFGANSSTEVEIMEECNYSSNVAYYRGLTRLCDYPDWKVTDQQLMTIKRAYATHVVGSHFWHGSHTFLGGSFDTRLISAIMYANQEALVDGFEYKSTVLSQLSEKPRKVTVHEVAGNMTQMAIDQPQTYWTQYLLETDYPQDYFTQFAAYIATVFAHIFPWEFTNWAIVGLCNKLVPGEPSAFIVNTYMPELEKAAGHFNLSFTKSIDLLGKFGAVLIKILYAFLWQEEFIPTSFLWSKPIISMGVAFAPTVYAFADKLSGFYENDEELNKMGKVFPGDKQCRVESPHALWHEVSANALINFAYLANHINGLSKHYEAKHASGAVDLEDLLLNPIQFMQ